MEICDRNTSTRRDTDITPTPSLLEKTFPYFVVTIIVVVIFVDPC